MGSPPSFDSLLDDDEEMEQLFREAFENMKLANREVDKMRPGASVSTPPLAAENNARGLVPKGEGSC